MTGFTIVLTYMLSILVLGLSGWGAYQVYRRLRLIELEQSRMNLAGIENSLRLERLVDELTSRQAASEQKAEASSPRPIQSINYTQRSQILRMARRGETVERIVGHLQVPANQVRLLVKLQGLTNGTVQAQAARCKSINSKK